MPIRVRGFLGERGDGTVQEAILQELERAFDIGAIFRRQFAVEDDMDAVWRGPEWVPTLPEIRDPEAWLARVRVAETASN